MRLLSSYRHVVLLLIVSSLLASCYPLATGSVKWRIVWKPADKEAKQDMLEQMRIKHADANHKPNIVLIVADDLGKYEVSSYGATHIHTPAIDRIGREGIRFADAYVSSPVCAPSRAALMTGRNQVRFGFETQTYEYYPSNIIEYISGKWANTEDWVISSKPVFPREWQIVKQGLPPSELTISELLQTAGYTTGIMGKWHLGQHRRLRPNNRGFDEQYGFYGAFSLYSPKRETPGYANHIQESFSAQYQWKSGRNEQGAIRRNDKRITEDDYLTFAIRDQAIDFMERNREEPFFLYVPFSAPHVPFQAPLEYYDRYAHVGDENKRVYYAMISALDDAVGAIHQRLIDLNLEDNTIIIFLSDNGGASYTGATDNGPLKGGKLNQFEGGINVPFLMKWKGQIPANSIYSYPVSSMDIFTTIAGVSDLTLPKDRIYDGVDLMPFIRGENGLPPHDILYWRADHVWAIRKGKYKLIMSNRDGWAELYDLEADRSERYNLRSKYPLIVQSMINDHVRWQQELPVKPLWPKFMDYRFVIDSTEYLFPA